MSYIKVGSTLRKYLVQSRLLSAEKLKVKHRKLNTFLDIL